MCYDVCELKKSARRKHMKILKCSVCGNVVEVLHDSSVPMMCCGQNMIELKGGETDGAFEKHVPYVEVKDGIIEVKVGEVMHPMLPEHHIEFIIVKAGDKVLRRNLVPGIEPVAVFDLQGYKGNVEVYEYCNLHGLWKKEIVID